MRVMEVVFQWLSLEARYIRDLARTSLLWSKLAGLRDSGRGVWGKGRGIKEGGGLDKEGSRKGYGKEGGPGEAGGGVGGWGP